MLFGDREGSGAKRVKRCLRFNSKELESCFQSLDLFNRKIIYGRPLSGKAFHSCGSVKMFQALGFESFLVDMPKECFPEFVQEFYVNLTTDKFGNYVSNVQDKIFTLNVPIMNCMLRIESPSDLSIYTKKGPVVIEGFGPLDQLNTVRGMNGILEFNYPTTSNVTPMAHLMFKVCLDNICP